MPLLGMGSETEKASPCRCCRGGMPWRLTTSRRKAIYSSANGRLLNDLVRNAREANRSRCCSRSGVNGSCRTVLRGREQIALSGRADVTAKAAIYQRRHGGRYQPARTGSGAESAWRVFWNRCNWRWTARRKKPDVIYPDRRRPFAID